MFISLYDLYHALMLEGGNDAAMVLAENFGILFYLHESKLPYNL